MDECIPQWLRRKNALLILDNCEHMLEPVAAIANAITRSCPDVRMLATTRQALGVSAEQVMRLASLDVPRKIADLTPTAIMEFGAVALFVDRARSIDRSFTLTDDTAPIVADICRRLDGIPLAIELAAARVKILSIPNLKRRCKFCMGAPALRPADRRAARGGGRFRGALLYARYAAVRDRSWALKVCAPNLRGQVVQFKAL